MVVDKLVLHGAPKALHRCVIVAVALSAHRYLHTKAVEQVQVLVGAVLAATVRMVDETFGGPFECDSLAIQDGELSDRLLCAL